jgi:hypothetical protein
MAASGAPSNRGETSRVAGATDGSQPPTAEAAMVAFGRRGERYRAALAAAGAWLTTVAPLVTSGTTPALTKVVALVSLAPGVAGPLLTVRGARLGRHVGISLFVAACASSWALGSLSAAIGTLDDYRAVLGVLAWGLYALAWWHPWRLPEAEIARVRIGASRGLAPRRRLPRSAAVVALAGVLGAALVWALAWRVDDRDRAVLAQALAVAASVALVTVTARVAVLMGRETREGQSQRLPVNRAVVNTMVLLGLLLAAAWVVFRSG